MTGEERPWIADFNGLPFDGSKNRLQVISFKSDLEASSNVVVPVVSSMWTKNCFPQTHSRCI